MPSQLRLLLSFSIVGLFAPAAQAIDGPNAVARIDIARSADLRPQMTSRFDFCLQDDSSGAILQFNQTTGAYVICGQSGNFFEQGVGVATTAGTVTTLSHTLVDRAFNGFETVHATVDTATNQGQAIVKASDENQGAFTLFSISDSNITNNTGCATCPELSAPVEGAINYTGTGLSQALGGTSTVTDYAVLQQFTLNSGFSGRLTDLTAVIGRNGGPGNLSYRFSVYSDNNGAPGSQIYLSPTITNSNLSALPSLYVVHDPVDLPPRSVYWAGLRWNPSTDPLYIPLDTNPGSPKVGVDTCAPIGTCDPVTNNSAFSDVRNIDFSLDGKFPTVIETTGLVRYGSGLSSSSDIISCKSSCSYTQIDLQPNRLVSLLAENGTGQSFPPTDFSSAFARITDLDVPNVIGLDGFSDFKYGTTRISAFSYSNGSDLFFGTRPEGVTNFVFHTLPGIPSGTYNYTRLAGLPNGFEYSAANGPADRIDRWLIQTGTSGWTSSALNPINQIYGPDFGGPWYKVASFGTTVSYEYQAKSGAIQNQWFNGNSLLGTLTLETDTLGSGAIASTRMGGDCNRDGICTFGRFQYHTGDNVADYIDFTQSPPEKATWRLGPSPQGFSFGRSVSVDSDSAHYASFTPSATAGQFNLQTDYYKLDTGLKYTLSYDFGAGNNHYPLSFARARGDWSLSTSKGLNLYTSLTEGCEPSRIRAPADGSTRPAGGGTAAPCENIATIGGRAGGSTGGNALLTPAAFSGNWTGDWNNTTFATTGPVALDASTNASAQTYSATLTLGGDVFGSNAPPPLTFGGSTVSPNGTYSFTSAAFGSVTFTFGADGAISGSAIGIPNPNISKVTFSGTITSEEISLDYTITLTAAAGGGTATGTVLLTKS